MKGQIVALGVVIATGATLGCRPAVVTTQLVTVPSVTQAPTPGVKSDDQESLTARQRVLFHLDQLGKAYRQAVNRRDSFFSRFAQTRFPPQGPDDVRPFLPSNLADLKSSRDGQPFVVVWGVDPDALSVAAQNTTLLAWEATPDATGQRCALFVAGFAGAMSEERFQGFEKAQPRHSPASARSDR